MQNRLGYFFIFLAAVCWGLVGPVGRFAMGEGVSPLEVGFWRAAFGGALFLLYAAKAGILKIHERHDIFVFMIFGACSLGGFFAANQYAIQTGGAALAAVLLYTAPAWVAVFARLFFGDRLTLIKGLAIGISLAGVACISLSGGGAESAGGTGALPGTGEPASAGILFGLLSGLLYSTHYIFSKKYLKRYKTYTVYGYALFFGAVTLFPFVTFAVKTPFQWGVLLFLGVIGTYTAYWAYCEGMKRLDPTRASVLATLEPVVATAAAWWLWDENFALTGWLGATLVIAAVIILVLNPQPQDKGECPPPEH